MVEIRDVKKVLKDTKKIIKHQNELSLAKGDYFNIFSILYSKLILAFSGNG